MIRWACIAAQSSLSDHAAARGLGWQLLADALLQEKGIRLDHGMLGRTPMGKPFLRSDPDIQFSLSHCAGLAACFIADAPAGIDTERLRPFSPYAARHVMTGLELSDILASEDPDFAFFQRWTLKESCLKAMGTGLGYPMRNLEFQIHGNDALCAAKPGYWFRVWRVAGDFVMAAALSPPLA